MKLGVFLILFGFLAEVCAFGRDLPVLNQYVLAAVNTMPKGKGYEASQGAVDRLAASVSVKNGMIEENLEKAGATFCSGATYVVWLRAIKMLQKNGSMKLSEDALELLASVDSSVASSADLVQRKAA